MQPARTWRTFGGRSAPTGSVRRWITRSVRSTKRSDTGDLHQRLGATAELGRERARATGETSAVSGFAGDREAELCGVVAREDRDLRARVEHRVELDLVGAP